MINNNKIVIAGSNGFLAKALIKHFLNKGYHVIGLNRNQSKNIGNLKLIKWDGKSIGDWCNEIDGAEAIINLVGRSVDCRYTEKNKKEVLNSRLDSTKIIGKAIQTLKEVPKLWINASSATIYRHSIDQKMNEKDGIIGEGFSVGICTAWEKMAEEYKPQNTRQVLLRTSMVMGRDGGVFPVLSKLVKMGLGGKQGNGNQYVSWVHIEDFINVVDWVLANEKLHGAINCTAPSPLTNKEFMKTLRKGWNIPIGLPALKCMLEIGAFFLRTETELILKSRRVVPNKLIESSFKFKYPSAFTAINHLIKNKIS